MLAYLRGGAIRGLGFRARRRNAGRRTYTSFFHPEKGPSSGPPTGSKENILRREPSRRSSSFHRDIENATATSGSHYEDDDQWETIDVCDPRGENVQRDEGEWLEGWRRGKERMMSMYEPPERLRFNPNLPLPPITVRSLLERRD